MTLLPESSEEGTWFVAKMLGTGYVVALFPLLVCGVTWSKAAWMALAFIPVTVPLWSILAIFLGRPLTTLYRKPSFWWHAVRFKRRMFPGSQRTRRWRREAPAVLRLGLARALMTTLLREACVQIRLLPQAEDPYEYFFFPTSALRAECAIVIAGNGAAFWASSRHGRVDLTCELRRDWYLGDEAFDTHVMAMGPAPCALAVLTPDKRQALLAIAKQDWLTIAVQCQPPLVHLSPGAFPFDRSASALWISRVGGAIAALAEFVKDLSIAEEDIVPALLANARTDPLGAVRRRNLEALASLNPGGDAMSKALAFARRDNDPFVRIWAAETAGDDWGFAELVALARMTFLPSQVRQEALRILIERWPAARTWPKVEPLLWNTEIIDFWLRERAVRQLVKQVPAARLWPVIQRLLEPGSGIRQAMLWETLVLTGDPEKVRLLVAHLMSSDYMTALEGLAYFNFCRNPVLEDSLMCLLRHESEMLRRSVVQTLGEVGSRRALPSLLDLATDPELSTDTELAIRKIHARERLGDAGQVSLAENLAAGNVALAEEAGGLSVAPEDEKGGPAEMMIRKIHARERLGDASQVALAENLAASNVALAEEAGGLSVAPEDEDGGAAESAIRKILAHERLGGAGQVSLAENLAAGNVALAEEAGGLSVAPEDEKGGAAETAIRKILARAHIEDEGEPSLSELDPRAGAEQVFEHELAARKDET